MKYTVSSPWTGFPSNIRYDMFNYTIWSTPSQVPRQDSINLINHPCSIHHMKYTVSCPPRESMHFRAYNSNFQLHHMKYTVWSPQTGFPTNIRYDMFYYTIWSTPSHVLLENPCIFLHITVIFNYTIWSTPSQVPGQDSLLILDMTYV